MNYTSTPNTIIYGPVDKTDVVVRLLERLVGVVVQRENGPPLVFVSLSGLSPGDGAAPPLVAGSMGAKLQTRRAECETKRELVPVERRTAV